MIALVRDIEGREGFVIGYSSGGSAECEWEEVLVACSDGKLRTYRTNELTFQGLMSEYGLKCLPVEKAKRV